MQVLCPDMHSFRAFAVFSSLLIFFNSVALVTVTNVVQLSHYVVPELYNPPKQKLCNPLVTSHLLSSSMNSSVLDIS